MTLHWAYDIVKTSKNNVPMIEIDCTNRENLTLDERLMLQEVICDDAELYYLDCFLTEMFAKRNE